MLFSFLLCGSFAGIKKYVMTICTASTYNSGPGHDAPVRMLFVLLPVLLVRTSCYCSPCRSR